MPIIIILLLIVGIVAVFISEEKQKSNLKSAIKQNENVDEKDIPEKLPYKRKYLLTKNESYFYKKLKSVADELGYTVLAKIRVADLVEVDVQDKKEWQKYFNKINKKHIDFALANPENLYIELLIELDDNSHNQKQEKRDKFIEKLYETTGYKLLRTRGETELKERIQEILSK